MDIQLLTTFLAVARLENVSQAAEKMNFTQPTVTAQIQALERHFDVQLFERVGKRIFLTEAGRQMIPEAEALLGQLDEIKRRMEPFRQNRHNLLLGISTQLLNYLLPPILAKAQKMLPGIRISIEVCQNSEAVNKRIVENQIDLGIIHGEAASSQVAQYQMLDEPILWVVNNELFAQYQQSEDVLDYPIVNFTKAGSVFRAKFEAAMKDRNFRSELEFTDSEAVKQAVLNGLGASYLPNALLHENIANGSLRRLQGPKLNLPISLIFHKSKKLSPAMQVFFAALSEFPGVDPALQHFLTEDK